MISKSQTIILPDRCLVDGRFEKFFPISSLFGDICVDSNGDVWKLVEIFEEGVKYGKRLSEDKFVELSWPLFEDGEIEL